MLRVNRSTVKTGIRLLLEVVILRFSGPKPTSGYGPNSFSEAAAQPNSHWLECSNISMILSSSSKLTIPAPNEVCPPTNPFICDLDKRPSVFVKLKHRFWLDRDVYLSSKYFFMKFQNGNKRYLWGSPP